MLWTSVSVTEVKLQLELVLKVRRRAKCVRSLRGLQMSSGIDHNGQTTLRVDPLYLATLELQSLASKVSSSSKGSFPDMRFDELSRFNSISLVSLNRENRVWSSVKTCGKFNLLSSDESWEDECVKDTGIQSRCKCS